VIKLFGIILILICSVIGVQADNYLIPDYSWGFMTITVNATAKRIAFTKSAGFAIQPVGNDVYIEKNATANMNKLKLSNGSLLDSQALYCKKGEYLTIVAPSATIATVNYTFKY
jgi:hypothetical protein